MNNDITNLNDKGQFHGYQEWYWRGNLWAKRFYNNAIQIDYEEFYDYYGNLEKRFYI